MNCILHDYLGQFVAVYLDDIIIHTKGTLEEHLDHLKQVFETLRRANLKIKLKKCYFCLPNIHFLGHVVGRDGIKPDPEKIEKIRTFPEPMNVSQLRSALELFSYYRRFIKDFSRIATPLNKLLRKDEPYDWKDKQQRAFDSLKERLITAPILIYPDFEKSFTLYTDASGTGIGAVLSQIGNDGKEHVVAYASRSMNQAEVNYPITDQECLAIVWAIRHFQHYLELQPFTIVTDHSALKWLQTSKIPKGRRARWIMELQQFKFTIKHRPGKANANADALSRMYEESDLGEIGMVECFMINVELCPDDDDIGSDWTILSKNFDRKQADPFPLKEKTDPNYIPDYYIYKPTQEEIFATYADNIVIKNVVANQPIRKGGSRCDFSCDIENHHTHTYCKLCKKNLPYGTVIHHCVFGFGPGQVHPGMDPKHLVNEIWWQEPEAVQQENFELWTEIYLPQLLKLYFRNQNSQDFSVDIAELD